VLIVADERDRRVLVDGYARVAALRDLARDMVEALELALKEEEALLFCRKLSGARPISALEEGWWCRELVEKHGKHPTEIAVALDRSPSWVSRRLALVRELPQSVQEAVRRGALSAQAAQKYLVPLARANAEHCERLVARLGAKGVSVREMHQLYVGWKGGDSEQRETLLAEPRLYLKACADRHSSEEPQESRLVKDLEAVVGLSRRIRAHLRGGGLDRLPWRARQAFVEAWREASLVFESLRHLMKKEDADAGSRHADSDLAPVARGTFDSLDLETGRCVPQRGALGDSQRLGGGAARRA
jgi:ParB-like chromosome segregation protein Spo0J